MTQHISTDFVVSKKSFNYSYHVASSPPTHVVKFCGSCDEQLIQNIFMKFNHRKSMLTLPLVLPQCHFDLPFGGLGSVI